MAVSKNSGKHGNVKSQHNTGRRVPDEIKKLRGTYHPKNDHAVLAKRKAKKMAEAAGLPAPVIPKEGEHIPSFICTERDLATPAGLLNEDARQEWDTVIKPLALVGVIRQTDLRVAELYCDMWGLYCEHRRDMRTPNGHAVFYPMKLAKEIANLLAQLGLTPAARAKLNLFMVGLPPNKPAPDKDDWSKILNT